MRLFGKLDGVLDRLDFAALLTPPMVLRRFAGYHIFRGVGSVSAIDYSAPVAFAPAESALAAFVQELPPNQQFVFAARSVLAGGLEDGNTHVFTCVQADADGELLPPSPPRPEDLTVDWLPTGDALLGFSCFSQIGCAPAERFEVLSDYGSGVLDPDNPIQTIDEVATGRTDFELVVLRPETSMLVAVRAVSAGRPGPVSAAAPLVLPLPPAPVVPL